MQSSQYLTPIIRASNTLLPEAIVRARVLALVPCRWRQKGGKSSPFMKCTFCLVAAQHMPGGKLSVKSSSVPSDSFASESSEDGSSFAKTFDSLLSRALLLPSSNFVSPLGFSLWSFAPLFAFLSVFSPRGFSSRGASSASAGTGSARRFSSRSFLLFSPLA